MADAVVVGSGPNGLTAAIALARAGVSVHVIERAGRIGGGMRTEELTLPGFQHDVCSAIHPLAVASPFLRQLPLAEHGVEWIEPPAALAHPFDDGTAALLERSPAATGATLGDATLVPGRATSARSHATRSRCSRTCSARPGCRGTRWRLRASASRAASPRASFARTAFRGERARGLLRRAWPRTRCCRSRSRRPPAYGLVLGTARARGRLAARARRVAAAR